MLTPLSLLSSLKLPCSKLSWFKLFYFKLGERKPGVNQAVLTKLHGTPHLF